MTRDRFAGRFIRKLQSVAALSGLFLCAPALPQTIVTEGTNLSADVRDDGAVVMDLLGKLWVVSERGGNAEPVPGIRMPARAPRWSPDGDHLLYEVSGGQGAGMWLHDMRRGASQTTGTDNSGREAAWHPSGERLVFSAPSAESGMDIWEQDLPTGLRWRVSSRPGDESEPAWSANGRHLTYVWHDGNDWYLVLRRNGMPEQVIYQSPHSLRVPSWRPDGSLITFLEAVADSYVLRMAILSEPPLVRDYSNVESDFFVSPVSWKDRHRMVYTADGRIIAREFGQRRGRQIHFRAALPGRLPARDATAVARRELPVISPPEEKFVIRTARLFDGVSRRYRQNADVVIQHGKIVEVARRRDHPDATLIDMGRATLMPGFVDLYSSVPKDSSPAAGSALLAFGVTTIVTDESIVTDSAWHKEANPGPRVVKAAVLNQPRPSEATSLYLATLPSETLIGDQRGQWVRNWQAAGIPVLSNNWTVGLGLGVDLLLGADTMPLASTGHEYQDMKVLASGGPVTLVSGLADATTPGMRRLLESRQAKVLGKPASQLRVRGGEILLDGRGGSVVAGSKPSGLPPGLALHAELLALQAAGLDGYDTLRAAGANAANVLGLSGQLGVIVPGALADMILVNGDPLSDIEDTLDIVAVVRNGRFFSLVSLLERASSTTRVGNFDNSGK